MKHFVSTKPNKKQWYFTASKDERFVDFSAIIESDTEPSFWECEALAAENGCEFWNIEEMEVIEEGIA